MDALRVVPANEASWDDISGILGPRGEAAGCWCQRFKHTGSWFRHVPREELADRLREQTACGDAGASYTTGLVGYLGDEAVGWCAVEPRPAYAKLLTMPIPWKERPHEDRQDSSVWAVTCLVTRAGYRGQGVMREMAAAAVDYARERGASALEAYPMITTPGVTVSWGEVHVGSRSVFQAAGLKQISHPTVRRVVMRIDF